MAISRWLNRLFQRITADSVSCGTLALWAAAMGLLIVAMQIFSTSKAL
ncbi:hypothetical protein [Altericista sp. CCNU0014]